MTNANPRHSHRVLLIGPKVPPYGGMALQARLMQELMNSEGISAEFLASNLLFPPALRFLEHIRGVRPFFRSAVFCWQLWELLGRIDVVHVLACSWLYFFVIVCPAVSISRLRGKRVILNYRGGEADQFFGRFSWLLRPFFQMAHVVTAPSAFLVKIIAKHFGLSAQVVPNIVNFSLFRYKQRRPVGPRMVVTRHLEKLYDIEAVIRAFSVVQREYPEASLRIAGTGQEEKFLRQLVCDLNLANVEFLGYVRQFDLPDLYDQCDILLNASRADNFPGSLVEAAASGLAVVSTNVGGIPHLFQDGQSALLFAPGNWQGLGEGVLRVLRDSELANRLTAEALQQCRRFDWKSVRQVLYPIYGFDPDSFEIGSSDPLQRALPEALTTGVSGR